MTDVDPSCGVAMRKTVAEAMGGPDRSLTTIKEHGDPEQVGGSGRHM
jgi:hypothetical protein